MNGFKDLNPLRRTKKGVFRAFTYRQCKLLSSIGRIWICAYKLARVGDANDGVNTRPCTSWWIWDRGFDWRLRLSRREGRIVRPG
jgi:hypothetical protein